MLQVSVTGRPVGVGRAVAVDPQRSCGTKAKDVLANQSGVVGGNGGDCAGQQGTTK